MNEDEFELVKITPNLYEETEQLFINTFLKLENIAIACDLRESEDVINEMKILLRSTLDDGVSFAARHRKTKQIAAFSANKLISNTTNESLEDICANFTTPNLLCVLDYLKRMEFTYNIFTEWNIDCVFEIAFVTTREDFAKRGLAVYVIQHSINFARKMLQEELSADECAELPEQAVGFKPKAITAVFTSKFTQRIGEKLGFIVLNTMSHTEFTFRGKTFAEKIEPIHPCSAFSAIKL